VAVAEAFVRGTPGVTVEPRTMPGVLGTNTVGVADALRAAEDAVVGVWVGVKVLVALPPEGTFVRVGVGVGVRVGVSVSTDTATGGLM
jgi:hypothetical protein